MCLLLCVSSLVHVSVRVFISLSCVFFSLFIVSTVCTVHCFHLSRCSRCYVFSLLCVFLVLCVVFPSCAVCGCCDSVKGVGCVLHVVIVCSGCCFCYCMCVCAACKKRGFHPAKNIYKKSAFFLKIIVVFLAYMKKKLYLCSVKMKE